MSTKSLLKRGALIVAANWPAVAIQLVARSTAQAMLGVPVVGAAVLVAVLLGADLVTLLQGSLREMSAAIAATLLSEPFALAAFIAAFVVVLLGGSVLLFLVKGGTVDVLAAAHLAAGPIETEPLTVARLRQASRFTLERFTRGCGRLFRPYLTVGLTLMVVYAVSGGAYLTLVVYGYRAATNGLLVIGWTFAAALSSAVLFVAWITIVNVLYLLVQIAIAVDGGGVVGAVSSVGRFIRAEFRSLARVVGVVVALVVASSLASALAWSGVGLIAFVPIVGLAVLPLQLAALLVRGLVFEYLGLTAIGAYLTLYLEHTAARRKAAARGGVVAPFERPA